VRYRVRNLSDGVIEIRRRSIAEAFLTPDVGILLALLCGWAVCIALLVKALVVDAALTSEVVVLGTAAVSIAIAVQRRPAETPEGGDRGLPPGGRAA
jgi:hypothetical protein